MATFENSAVGYAVQMTDVDEVLKQLIKLGGTQADYMLEWGGNNPQFIRVTTALDGITNEQLQAVINGYSPVPVAVRKLATEQLARRKRGLILQRKFTTILDKEFKATWLI